jgi:DNA-binding response OmpR family regulator
LRLRIADSKYCRTTPFNQTKCSWGTTQNRDAAHLLRVTLSHLHHKLKIDPKLPSHILTEPGVGYRLTTESSDWVA